MKRKIFVALLHFPIVNRHGEEVVTAVTNLDIHDIARSCKTFGVTKYFIVNPEKEQAQIVGQIVGHWKQEVSKVYHPARAQALDLVQYSYTFEEAMNEAQRIALEDDSMASMSPFVVMPDARDWGEEWRSKLWSYAHLRTKLQENRLHNEDDGHQPLMIVYGTGWGISPRFFSKVDRILDPLRAYPNEINHMARYNHLSVRAAAAIVLDRILGT